MKTAEEQMAFYQAYHKNRWNKALHFVGIPSIIFSILIPMSWPGIHAGPVKVTVAMAFLLVIMAYYFALESTLAVGTVIFILPTLYAAHQAAGLSWTAGLAIFFIAFSVGWTFQLVGHYVFENRRPALLDNFFQIFIAPIYFLAEILFALGYKRDLQVRIDAAEAASPSPRRAAAAKRATV
jgi:uncharacterized membrane protein YGL010W